MATSGDRGEGEAPGEADGVIMPSGIGRDTIRYMASNDITPLSVLEGNSNITADSGRQDYVPTPALEEADEILQNTGYVILCGPPGSGKTTLAKALSRRSREQGFSLYNLEGLQLWRSNVGEHEHSVVVLDGIFGQVYVYNQQFICWRNILSTVLEQIHLGMCRLVITVYPHILRELQLWENHLHSPFKDDYAVVRLMSEIPAHIRGKLLTFHLNRVPVQPDRQSEIVKDVLEKDVSGPAFPWCCGYMVKNWSSSEDPTAIFLVPAEAYTGLMKDLVLDKTHEGVFAAVLVLAMRRVSHFLHNPSEALPHLKELGFESHSNDTLAACADVLRGSILLGRTFASRALYEAAGLALGRYFRFATLLKVCDVPFLVKYVHLTAKDQEIPEEQPSSMCVTVGSVPSCSEDPEHCLQDLQAFVERIYTDIIQGDLQHICQHPCLQCPQFLQELDNYCAQDRKRIKQLLTAVDPVHKLPLVYWSVFLPPDTLTYWCLSKMMIEAKVTALVLMACSLFDIITHMSEDRLKALVQRKIRTELFKQSECAIDFPLLGKDKCLTKETQKQVETITGTESSQRSLLYLHDQSLIIPSDIVRFQQTKDRFQLQVKDWHHWYLVFRLLTDREVSDTDRDGNSVLHVAVGCGQSTAVKLCLKAGAVISQHNSQGETVYQLSHKTCPWLSRNKKQVNVDEIFTRFPTMEKVEVQLVLLEDISLNARNSEGRTGLHAVCHIGRVDLVDLYIELGADVTSTTTTDGLTALHFAGLCPSHAASADITRLLLQAGADVNMQDQNGATPLQYVAMNGHLDTAELLISHGVNVNMQNVYGSTALLCAVMSGHSDTADLLMHHGADVNRQDKEGDSPLLRSVINSHQNIAELLICHGADINLQNRKGFTPLVIAVRNDLTDTAELLICHGADVNVNNSSGFKAVLSSPGAPFQADPTTALHWACRNGMVHTVQLLIQHHVDVAAATLERLTALHFACLCPSRSASADITRLLLQAGADVNMRNAWGATPLLYAAWKDRSDTAQLLIHHGANVNVQSTSCFDVALPGDPYQADPSTALHWACRNGMVQTVQLLIQHQADVTATTRYGQTALHIACLCSSHTASADITCLLLQAGADANTQNKWGVTPLLYAARNSHSDTAELLICHGADVNVIKSSCTHFFGRPLQVDPSTALHWACQNGMVRTVQLLIQHQADVTASTKEGLTALHFASLCPSHTASAAITPLLLQAGADVNAQNKRFDSPLLRAAKNGHSDTAELLIHHGADVNTQDKWGDTPLLLSAKNCHSDTAQLLICHGADINKRNHSGQTPLLFL